MSKKIYLIFLCDEWKSKSSMRLNGVFLNYKKFQRATKKLIKNGVVELEVDEKWSNNWTIEEINNHVKYFFVYEAENGEFDQDGGLLV